MTEQQADRLSTFPVEAPAGEGHDLAQELARSFGQLVAGYRHHFGLTPEEARTRACDDAGQVEYIRSSPPDQVSWFDLDTLERHSPGQALVRWEELKEAAREELQNGFRAARAMEGGESRCWDRARFLAIRSELLAAVHPRSALEGMLVDQLAQWQTLLLLWQENVAIYSALEGARSARRNGGIPELPRLSVAEAFEKAVETMERFHRLYLRTLKALQDLCKVPTSVAMPRLDQMDVGDINLKVYG